MKRRAPSPFLLLLAGLLFTAQSAPTTKEVVPPFPRAASSRNIPCSLLVVFVNQHERYLRNKAEALADWRSAHRNLPSLFAEPIPLDCADSTVRSILGAVFQIGVFNSAQRSTSQYIQDSICLHTIIDALPCSRPGILAMAQGYLLRNVKSEDLSKSAAQLQSVLGQDTTIEAIRIMALVPLSAERKREYLAKPSLPLALRARLGDRKAERAIIDSLLASSTYGDRMELVQEASYVGTATCSEALIKSLYSPLFRAGYQCTTSIRLPLIEALARMNPSCPLFARTRLDSILLLDGYGGSGRDSVRSYVQKVVAWGQATYHVSPMDPEPKVLYIRRQPTVRPSFHPNRTKR